MAAKQDRNALRPHTRPGAAFFQMQIDPSQFHRPPILLTGRMETESEVSVSGATNEYEGGQSAPVAGVYLKQNVVGSWTGIRMFVGKGEKLPALPRGFTWRLASFEDPGIAGG